MSLLQEGCAPSFSDRLRRFVGSLDIDHVDFSVRIDYRVRRWPRATCTEENCRRCSHHRQNAVQWSELCPNQRKNQEERFRLVNAIIQQLLASTATDFTVGVFAHDDVTPAAILLSFRDGVKGVGIEQKLQPFESVGEQALRVASRRV